MRDCYSRRQEGEQGIKALSTNKKLHFMQNEGQFSYFNSNHNQMSRPFVLSALAFFMLGVADRSIAQNQVSSPTGQSLRIKSDTVGIKEPMRIDSGFIKLGNYRFLGMTKGVGGKLNSWAGINSGNLTMTGEWNVFLGEGAGSVNTSGSKNTFAGTFSGMANTTGSDNVFLGYKAGLSNTTGGKNVFIGPTTANGNTSGGSNLMVGMDAGYFNTTGSNNVFLGRNAGLSNASGNNNVAVGTSAGSIATGSGNLYLGPDAGKNNGAANNRLYIDNTATATPLIYGEFGTTSPVFEGKVVVNGRMSINSSTFPAMVDTNNTSGFKLFVNGGVLVKKLVYNTSWADYVFEPVYKLRDLAQVEIYIKENGHLPGVGPAAELESTGIDLGAIKKMQQEKIEELTLYAIGQNKELDKQQGMLRQQQKIITALIKRASSIKID
jgi:hypothetical protein